MRCWKISGEISRCREFDGHRAASRRAAGDAMAERSVFSHFTLPYAGTNRSGAKGLRVSPHSQRASAPPVLFNWRELYARYDVRQSSDAIMAKATSGHLANTGRSHDVRPPGPDRYPARAPGRLHRRDEWARTPRRENEPGIVRFDVITDEKEPNRAYFYESTWIGRHSTPMPRARASPSTARDRGLAHRHTTVGRGESAYPPDDDAY